MVILLGPAMSELRDALATKAPGGGAAPPAGSKQVPPRPALPKDLPPSPLAPSGRGHAQARAHERCVRRPRRSRYPSPPPSPLALACLPPPSPPPPPLACAQEGAQGGAQGEGAQEEGAKLEEAERAWRERCAAHRGPGAAAAAEGSETFEVNQP